MAARRKTWRLPVFAGLLLLVLLPINLALLYAAVAWTLVLFPLNSGSAAAAPAIDAYVLSNGVHTDLVFPVKSKLIDWESRFPKKDFAAVPADADYIAIGWGDRDFYLNTPEWKDLTLSRALGALTGRHGALLHVTYLRKADLLQQAYTMRLSEDSYRELILHVESSARLQDGRSVAVPGRYGSQDAFYEALGSYSVFTTCNTWTGTGLRRAGIKVSRWTPFDTLVVWHLPRYIHG
ncbi:TIGR02117 family protein [Undibacterium sp. TJN25]|uniref:TIGR02117 family protein n=1 Tax=Undibacterium sp. TJN25 TaxID=3413056 RepID=UPI003BEFEDF6